MVTGWAGGKKMVTGTLHVGLPCGRYKQCEVPFEEAGKVGLGKSSHFRPGGSGAPDKKTAVGMVKLVG